MVDVTIVGAGLAGLISANLLAKEGKSVVVFERGKILGGRARTENEHGYQFNLGPHALYRGGDAARILTDLGISYSGGIPPAKGAMLLRGERLHLLPGTLTSLLQTRALGLAAKLEFAKAFSQIAKLDPFPLESITLNDWLGRLVKREETKQVLRSLFRVSTYANDPDFQSAGAALRQLQCGLAGVIYLDGGWQSMVDGLRTAAARLGVEFRTGSRIDSVLMEEGRARGVKSAAGVQKSRSVLLATPPAAVADMLSEVPHLDLHRFAKEAIPVQAACLNIGLRKLPYPKQRFALGMDEPLYFSVHSLFAKLGPKGAGVIQIARYMSSGENDPDRTKRQLEALLEKMQPGWRQHVVVQQYLPRMTVVPALDLARSHGSLGRPDVRVPGVEHLWIAGDWVGPEGMLGDAAAASAAKCSRGILEEDANFVRSEATRNVARV